MINIYIHESTKHKHRGYLITDKILSSNIRCFIEINDLKVDSYQTQVLLDMNILPKFYNVTFSINNLFNIDQNIIKTFSLLNKDSIVLFIDQLNNYKKDLYKSLYISTTNNNIDNLISIVNLALYND